MREKAFQVYSQFRSGNAVPNRTLSVGKPDYGDDELALFGGQTRVLVSKLLSNSMKHRKQSQPSSAATSAVSSPSSEDSRGAHPPDSSREVHPSLVEYLSMFPPPNVSSRNSPCEEGALNNLPPISSVAPTNGTPDPPMYQHWTTPSLFTPLPPETFSTITSELQPFASTNLYGQNGPSLEAEPKVDPSTSLVDLGMMMTGESGMDEQWMSFMRDSGLLQVNPSGLPVYTTLPTSYSNSDMPQYN